MKIKDFAKVDMPREKLEKYGERKLADHELLAIILGSGIRGSNVLDISKKIVRMIDHEGKDKVTLERLLSIRGLGKAKALQILSVIALTKRFGMSDNPEALTSSDIWKLCIDFKDSMREHFVAFYTDSRDRVIERQVISIGTLDATLAHPREVFEPAISLRAANVIIAHNHPSGSLVPSPEDIELTKKLIYSGKLLGIPLKDHLIVTKTSYESILRYSQHD